VHKLKINLQELYQTVTAEVAYLDIYKHLWKRTAN